MTKLALTTKFGEEPEIIEQVQQEIIAFCGNQPQFDDITLMILKTF
jgi:serine phosphatase RsbU (regulator of sigma subunit)